MNNNCFHPVSMLQRLQARRGTLLRVMQVLVAVVSLTTGASCAKYPFDPWDATSRQLRCVNGDMIAHPENLPLCEEDANDDEEEQKGPRDKKRVEVVKPD